MILDKAGAKEQIETAVKLYVAAQAEQESAHDNLKSWIRRASTETRLTQQDIADATVVESRQGGSYDLIGFSLTRQRISQILNEEA